MKLRRFLAVFLMAVLLGCQCFIVPAYGAEPIAIDAKAALLVDGQSGAVLYEQNAHSRQYPASITKVMTALLVLEAIDQGKLSLAQTVTATASGVAGLPSDASTADIQAGETLTVEQLLYCLLVVSANEVGNILGETVSGSVSAFVAAMNTRAAQLGCEDTHFANTSGLPDPDHYTTARDIYTFTKAAMQYDLFMQICNTKAYTVPATNLHEQRELHSTNYLISNWRASGYLYDGAQGIKTGSTEAAGHCLVAAATRSGRQLISVVLGAKEVDNEHGGTTVQSFTETSRLFDWGFANFSTQLVLSASEMVQEVPVALSKETDYVVVHPAYDAAAVLPNDLEVAQLERTVTLVSETVDAPITAGDELGVITVSYNGVDYVTVPLLALNDVSSSNFLIMKRALSDFFSRTIVKIALVALVALAVVIAVFGRTLMRRKRYGDRNKRVRSRSYRGRRF